MLIIRKRDDVHLTIDGDKSDMMDLSEWFTFDAPNAKFDPRVKAKFWDGKIRLVNLNERTIPAGLIHEIIQFAKMTDTELVLEGSKHSFPGIPKDIPPKIIDGFMEVLAPVDTEGNELVYDSWQANAIHHAITNERGILVSPTASGKSLILYTLMRWYREVQSKRVLMVVPQIGLVTQLALNFKEYSGGQFNDYDTSVSGAHRDGTASVLVSTWQSLTRMPPDYFEQFGAVLVDEVHTAEAKSLQWLMRQLKDCPFRIGVTGTLKDMKTHQLALKGAFGEIRQVTTTREMIDAGRASEIEIHIIQLQWPKDKIKELKRLIKAEHEKENGAGAYQIEIDAITSNAKRNEIVANMAIRARGCTLVLFKNREHGDVLYNLITNATDKPVVYIDGTIHVDDREAARQAAEKDDIIIVASLGTFSTGINIKKLHNLIFAHPTKSKIKVLQSIGRLLRISPDGRSAKIYDLVDDMRQGSFTNFAWTHGEERLMRYIDEQFPYKTRTLEL